MPASGARRSPTGTVRCRSAAGQTISQPYIVARMTELLHVARGRPGPGRRAPGPGYAGGGPRGAGLPRDDASSGSRPWRRRPRDPPRQPWATRTGWTCARATAAWACPRRRPGTASWSAAAAPAGPRRPARAAGRRTPPGDPGRLAPGAAADGGGAARRRVAGDVGRGVRVRPADRRRGLAALTACGWASCTEHRNMPRACGARSG